MSDKQPQHVFVSYVREDAAQVDALCKVLDASQIPYWRDRKSLAPGDAWKAKIREAIRGGSLIFLACFSDSSRSREKSYMNEELTLAVEEFRKLPPGRTWLIPVRFDEGPIPEWELSPSRTLSDLNSVDLFGADYAPQAASLVATIGRTMGTTGPDPATVLAAVEEANDADRALLLRRVTKELLPDPTRRIQLDDLVSSEVRRVLDAMSDPGQFPTGPLTGTEAEKVGVLVETSTRYWKLIEPFCNSLQVAARWATEEQLEPWITGIRSIAAAANKMQSGTVAMIELRSIPALMAVMTASLSCIASGRWGNLRGLVADQTAKDRYGRGKTMPLLEVINPWEPFQSAELAASALSRAATTGESPELAATHFLEQKGGKYFTPVSDWMHSVLRTVFNEQLPDDDSYDSQFDRTEVYLGLLGQDLANESYSGSPEMAWRANSRWFGRSTWRSQRTYDSPLADIHGELEKSGLSWPPLREELFGSDVQRVRVALEKYEVDFQEISRRRF